MDDIVAKDINAPTLQRQDESTSFPDRRPRTLKVIKKCMYVLDFIQLFAVLLARYVSFFVALLRFCFQIFKELNIIGC